MADFTTTISMSVNVFQQPNLWGTMLWGDNWGYGASLPLEVEKLISESINSADSVSKDVEKLTEIGTMSAAFEMAEETLQDGKGYYEVFTRPTIDAENRNLTAFSEVSTPTTSWTEASEPTTTWSEE